MQAWEIDMKYVLRRYDRDAHLPLLMVGYTEQVTAVPIELGGISAPTLFLQSVHTRNRALKMGWKDETDRYNAHAARAEAAAKREEAVVGTFATAQPRRKRKG
jgi:hypothetical protein